MAYKPTSLGTGVAMGLQEYVPTAQEQAKMAYAFSPPSSPSTSYANQPMQGYTTTYPTPGYAEAQQKTLTDYIKMAESQAAQARAANLQRYSQIQGIYDEIIARYQPGGGFMAGAEAGLEQQKGRDVASEVAQTISSGLYGTTVPSTAAKRWEMDVGAPQRLKLEDIRTQALSQAQVGKAGVIERREDTYPDYSMIAQLISQSAQTSQAAPRQRSYTDWMQNT